MFSVGSGVTQGCNLSPLLFLITINWIMCKTTFDKPRGIEWALFSHLEELDFADDLAVLSSKLEHLQEKTDRLTRYAKGTELNINASKTQVMYINNSQNAPITVNGKPLENVEDFTYLGSLISKDNGAQKYINARLGKLAAPLQDFDPSGSQTSAD